ncbi:MAG: hypothetical protein ACQEQ4_10245 [Fibrobacterota bacterium]
MNIVISAEIIGLIILSSLTIVAYMIAMNANGITRISLSFLMATILLGGTVFTVVQYVNNPVSSDGAEVSRAEEAAMERELLAQKLQEERREIEKEEEEEQNKKMEERRREARRLISFISDCESLARELNTIQVVDRSRSYSGLVQRAQNYTRRVNSLQERFRDIQENMTYFVSMGTDVRKALDEMERSASFFRSYYTADNSYEEAQREQMLRNYSNRARIQMGQLKQVLQESL